jgi:hypothetical protein
MAITLDIIREDLSFLYTVSMDWGQDFANQVGRFEDVLGQAILLDTRQAYWLPDWTTAMIFRAYLTSINASFQILLDNAEDLDPYVVLTKEEF